MANGPNNDALKAAQAAAKAAQRAFKDAKEELASFSTEQTISREEFRRLQKAANDTADALERETRATNDAKESLERLREEKEKLSKAADKSNERLSKTASLLGELAPGADKVAEAFKKNEDNVIRLEEVFSSLSDSFISGMMKMAATMETTNVALARQTGYATALRQDVIDLTSTHNDLYLTMEQGQEVVGALSIGFKMYNAQSKQTRGEINYLAGRFKTLGVDTNAFATVLDQLNEGFGLTGPAALAAAAELENLAIRTGSPLSAVVGDFQDLGPQMSRFGSDGVRVFTRLNEQARTLGMTTRQAFDLSELFDTFESSADVAGKLNAQLGLQLNSVELMAASSEDRLKILRAEFDLEGMRFDQMGRRQRQMVADILQTDVLTAEKLLGDPMALREFQKEEENRNERIKSFNSSMEKFTSIAQKLFINLEPVITPLLGVLNSLAEALNYVVTSFVGPLISKLMLFGVVVAKVAKFTKPLGFIFSAVAKIVGSILVPFLILKDVIQSIPGVGDSKSRSAARSRLAAGATGALTVGLATGGFGALAGYGIGREVPGMAASFANDKMETIKGSAVLKRSDGSMTRFAAGDTFTARKDGGDLSQLVKGVNELVAVNKKMLAKEFRVYLDGREIGSNENVREAIAKGHDPVYA